jgi:hypothetical protein
LHDKFSAKCALLGLPERAGREKGTELGLNPSQAAPDGGAFAYLPVPVTGIFFCQVPIVSSTVTSALDKPVLVGLKATSKVH